MPLIIFEWILTKFSGALKSRLSVVEMERPGLPSNSPVLTRRMTLHSTSVSTMDTRIILCLVRRFGPADRALALLLSWLASMLPLPLPLSLLLPTRNTRTPVGATTFVVLTLAPSATEAIGKSRVYR
jgi:hypothetical protein